MKTGKKKEAPACATRFCHVNMSARELLARFVDAKPNAPASENAGYICPTATPMSADWDAAARPALRTSGRRRSRSLGIPTVASGGAAGIPLPPVRRESTASGVVPSRSASASFAWRSEFWSEGICACVCASRVVACRTSSSLVSPYWNWTEATRRLSFCVSTFLAATRSRSSAVRTFM